MLTKFDKITLHLYHICWVTSINSLIIDAIWHQTKIITAFKKSGSVPAFYGRGLSGKIRLKSS